MRLFGALFIVFAAAGVLSQDTNPSTSPKEKAAKIPPVQERVEVTTTRLPEDPHEDPAPIEVITGDELRARGATDLRTALSPAIGVEIAPGGDAGPASSVPAFWGLKEFDAFLLLVDGVPWGGAFNPSLTSLSLPSHSPLGTLRHTQPIFEDPSRVTGKRDYISGDSLRRVDWKATAATGRLHGLAVAGGLAGAGLGALIGSRIRVSALQTLPPPHRGPGHRGSRLVIAAVSIVAPSD